MSREPVSLQDPAPEPSGPGTRQARGRARRSIIVDSAITLFASRGFRGTTIAAVAEQAGLTDAGVLYHFRTKADLLLAVLSHYDERDGATFAASAGLGPAQEIARLRDWGEVMEREPDLTALLVTLSAEHLRDRSPTNTYFRVRYDSVATQFEKMFVRAAEHGLVRGDLDARAEAIAVVALLDGIRLQWFFSDGKVSIADAVRRHIDLTLERLAP